ncbi:MAG: T9SS type A sorting domain-containing protein [Saprospiraceae bacterium]
MKQFILLLWVQIFSIYNLYSQQWSFDTTFGNAGKTSFNLAKSADFLHNIAITIEGNIYAVGEINEGGYSGTAKVLVRFNAEGKIDQNFSNKGYLELNNFSEILDIKVQQDGKIVIAGLESYASGYTIRRYLPNGGRDLNFGSGGKATHPLLEDSKLHSIILMPDGNILGVGASNYSVFKSNFLLVKFNSNGSLNTSFGVGGVVNNTKAQGIAYDIVLQKDEKFVAVGYNKNVKMNAIRFNPDGSIDLSFGNNGVMVYESGEAKKILIQDNDNLVIGGISSGFDTLETRLFRIMPDGVLDESFTVFSSISPRKNYAESLFEKDYGLILLDNGRIIQSFYREVDGLSDIVLTMFDTDGTIYKSFGNEGQLVIDLSNVFERGGTLLLDQSGKIIVSGISDLDMVLLKVDTSGNIYTQYGGKFNFADGDDQVIDISLYPDGKILVNAINGPAIKYDRDLLICRLDQTGTLDSSFAGTGVLLSGHNSDLSRARAIEVTPEGNAILAGHDYDNWVEVSKLLPNGMVDQSFGDEGYVRFTFKDSSYRFNNVTSLLIQKDGKILIGGIWGLLDYHFALARLFPDGSFDPEFGSNGTIITAFPDEEGTLTCLATDELGSIFAGGLHELPGTDEQFAIIKYLSDGRLDKSFGLNGIATFLVRQSCSISDIVSQEDGKIIVIGNAETNSGKTSVGLLRIHGTTGLPDLSFGDDGWVFSDFGTEQSAAFSGLLQDDGKILVAGISLTGANQSFSLGRWQKNGDIDTTFGNSGYIIFNFGSSLSGCTDMLIQPDNSILLAGANINNTGGIDIALARILNSLNVGTVDVENQKEVLLVYPNPIGDQVNLKFELKEAGHCEISLYNIHGNLIQIFERDKSFPSGSNVVTIIPDNNLSSGAYFLRLNCGTKPHVGVMVYKK